MKAEACAFAVAVVAALAFACPPIAAADTGATVTEVAALDDTTPPETFFSSSPRGVITDNTPTFEFSSTDPTATFQCRFDEDDWSPCTSPYTSRKLKDGSHAFYVRAVDPAGNTDPQPAKSPFRVDTTAPGLKVDLRPKPKIHQDSAVFGFSSKDPRAKFTCKRDKGRYQPCESPRKWRGIKFGRHVMRIVATDNVGNASPPVKIKFKRVPKKH